MNDATGAIQSGISFRSVSWIRERRSILSNVDFDAPMGSITTLFGPSGAGKTTCMRLIAGLETPNEGQVFLNGELASSPQNCIPPRQRKVGFCFQEDALWPALSVRDHIAVVLGSRYRDPVWIDMQTQELLNRFGLAQAAPRKPAYLSGGEKKRLALARSLAMNPAILLLDEPLSSLDGPARGELISYLKTCKREDRTVLLVTHHLEEAFALGDRLVILVDGAVVQQGALRDVLQHPRNIEAARLLGYRNFFPVCIEEGCAKSPLGSWTAPENLRGEYTAAAFGQDVWAESDPAGTAIVDICWPETRHFRILARYTHETYEAFAERECAVGERVSLRVRNTPAIF